MILTLQREPSTAHSTFGVLYVNGVFECFTLEDPVREEKIKGMTAIPAGRYQIVRTYSHRFRRTLPLLLSVVGFEGIRIHPGNTEHDTEGCLLPGQTRTPSQVLRSRIAFDLLDEKIQNALQTEAVWIVIRSAEGVFA